MDKDIWFYLFKMIELLDSNSRKALEKLTGEIVKIFDWQLLGLIFAIQFTILVIYFLIESDWFEFFTDSLKLCISYGVIMAVLSQWPTLGPSFFDYVNEKLSKAVYDNANPIKGLSEKVVQILEKFKDGMPVFKPTSPASNDAPYDQQPGA